MVEGLHGEDFAGDVFSKWGSNGADGVCPVLGLDEFSDLIGGGGMALEVFSGIDPFEPLFDDGFGVVGILRDEGVEGDEKANE